jgi:hypothetical protein
MAQMRHIFGSGPKYSPNYRGGHFEITTTTGTKTLATLSVGFEIDTLERLASFTVL